MATIAVTGTRAGIVVDAELDPNSYPLGISVTRQELAALPIRAHAHHGEWNYTIAPSAPEATTALRVDDRAQARAQALTLLNDPRLTGMSTTELDRLTTALAPEQAAQASQRRYEQRGGRRRAPGAGGTGLLSNTDRILVTIVYQRQTCSQNVLSDLIGINANTIGQAIAETRQLLTDHGHAITASTLRFATATALRAFASTTDDVPSRSGIAELLADPALTGMPQADLTALTRRAEAVQASRRQRHRHRRRGGEPLPGARGGVFTQKITDAERVLATVLYQRNLCSQDSLAKLFEVSRRTISDVVREVGPILRQDGYQPAPAPTRFPDAAALLNATPNTSTTTTLPT